MSRFVIGSESEEGWWNNQLGWVWRIQDATQFTEAERRRSALPMSKGKDAEWQRLKECSPVTCRLSCANDLGACLAHCRA